MDLGVGGSSPLSHPLKALRQRELRKAFFLASRPFDARRYAGATVPPKIRRGADSLRQRGEGPSERVGRLATWDRQDGRESGGGLGVLLACGESSSTSWMADVVG